MYADKGHATKHMIKNGKEVGRDLKPLESQRNARDATWVDLLDSANPRWLKTQSTHSTFLKFITLLPSLVVQEFLACHDLWFQLTSDYDRTGGCVSQSRNKT